MQGGLNQISKPGDAIRKYVMKISSKKSPTGFRTEQLADLPKF